MRTLTGEQCEAVDRRGEPLLLAAGAGSGKTSVLVERFVQAVLADGVDPANILAITFTERAAGELRERVRRRFLELGEREAARDTEAAFVSTFHGFCARLLRTHALAAGIDPEFSILEEPIATRLRRRAFAEVLRDFLHGERAGAVDLLAAYGGDEVRATVLAAYAQLRSRGARHPRLPAPRGSSDEQDAAAAVLLLDELLDRFGVAYEASKNARAALDFDDLELLARDLLIDRSGIRAAWSERFALLMVDEFQDTNPRQLAILQALERENLFTVGDELQSIYGFRHADVSLFRDRRDELAESGRSLQLARNFRSRPPLLRAVNAVFRERFGAGYTPLLGAREEPTHDPLVELLLTTTGGWDEEERERARAGGVAVWRQAEAQMLAARIAELIERGDALPGEVAVLLRATTDLEVYERALQDAGLRTLAAVGSFWGRQQVGDLLSYLRILANPLDELALYSTLASPLVGLSSDGLVLIARAAAARPGRRQAWAAIREAGVELLERLPVSDAQALLDFRAGFEHERIGAPQRTISRLLERAVELNGYREHVLGLDWGERRLANIHKLLRLARRFEAGEGRDLRGFLDYASDLQEAGNFSEPDAPVAGAEPDAVQLMSIHAAKGLEFGVVCIADLGRLPRPSSPVLLLDGDRVGLRLAHLDGSERSSTLDYEQLCEERKLAEAFEEERILYVAMTRARERLLLSGAVDFEKWPQDRPSSAAIAWLAPALAAELPELALADLRAGEWPLHDLSVGGDGATRLRCRFNAPGVGVLRAVPDVSGSVLPPPPPRAGAPATSAQPAPATPNEQLSFDQIEALAPPADPHPAIPAPAPAYAPGRVVPGQAPAREAIESLSYTTLSELERCGYRYYLERVLGLPEVRSAARAGAPGAEEGIEARARGTLVHLLLEAVDFARPAPPSLEQVSAAAAELGQRISRVQCEEVLALIAAALAPTAVGAPPARLAAASKLRREHPFAFSLGPREPLVSGFIDVLAIEPGGTVLVVDYKTDRIAPDADLAALVERDYGVQRLLYALAVLRDGAAAVEVVHWFLERPADWVGARLSGAERETLEAELAARIDSARNRSFIPSENPHRGLCETCPGRAGLCSWSDAETMREEPAQESPATPL